MKLKYKMMIIILSILLILTIGYSVYALFLSPKPEDFVLNYLNVRYNGTDYTNIEEKAELQRTFLAEELIYTDFYFGNFNEEINYFNEQKYIIDKAEFNIYDVNKQDEFINVYTRVYFNVKSDLNQGWSQLSYYNLQFLLNKDKEGLQIKDIIILDNKYQIPLNKE